MTRVENWLTEAEAHRHYEADLEEWVEAIGGRNRSLRAVRRSLKYYPAGQTTLERLDSMRQAL